MTKLTESGDMMAILCDYEKLGEIIDYDENIPSKEIQEFFCRLSPDTIAEQLMPMINMTQYTDHVSKSYNIIDNNYTGKIHSNQFNINS